MNVLGAAGVTKRGALTAIKLKAQSDERVETVVAKRRVRIRKTPSDSEITKRAAWTFVDAASQSSSGCSISVTINSAKRGNILLAKYRNRVSTTARSMKSRKRSLEVRADTRQTPPFRGAGIQLHTDRPKNAAGLLASPTVGELWSKFILPRTLINLAQSGRA